ncbi:ROK family protein [Devosia sp. BK]|uniref:ROK family protein n=1 Tax=Devosia sp. BK TaxID=2871706 RepID=UPI002939677B|nr:ROK family protein [Devosia sp. BK]MDV3253761.1 ROK family protein [Devosia sp. BK]
MVVRLVRTSGVVSPSSLALQLGISIPTVMRIVSDLMAEELVAYDGHDESARGRPPSRVKFQGASHAIIGIEAMRGKIYGAVSDLNGNIQVERQVSADDDGPKNVERLIALIKELIAEPRPTGQTLKGIGVGVPSIVRQPAGDVVLTMGLGWKDLGLRSILQRRFDIPVFVENGRNLAAVGEWGFGAGQGAGTVVSVSIGPGAGAGVVVDGKLYRGRGNAAGELAWYLDDPILSGRSFAGLGDKQSLRFGAGIPDPVFVALERADREYVAGKLPLDALASLKTAEGAMLADLLDYTTIAVASVTAFMNPDVVVLAGKIALGAELMVAVLQQRLADNVYDPPTIVVSPLGHRDIVMGAIMHVLDATILDPQLRFVGPAGLTSRDT